MIIIVTYHYCHYYYCVFKALLSNVLCDVTIHIMLTVAVVLFALAASPFAAGRPSVGCPAGALGQSHRDGLQSAQGGRGNAPARGDVAL